MSLHVNPKITEKNIWTEPSQENDSYDSWYNIPRKKNLMEKGLANPNWLVTTRIAPSFPWKYFQSYNGITNAASTAK